MKPFIVIQQERITRVYRVSASDRHDAINRVIHGTPPQAACIHTRHSDPEWTAVEAEGERT